jgi:hypothetical protein
MSEHILTPILAFMLLAGGTLAIGFELFSPAGLQPAARTVAIELPKVEVTGRRIAAPLTIAAIGAAPQAQQTCIE